MLSLPEALPLRRGSGAGAAASAAAAFLARKLESPSSSFWKMHLGSDDKNKSNTAASAGDGKGSRRGSFRRPSTSSESEAEPEEPIVDGTQEYRREEGDVVLDDDDNSEENGSEENEEDPNQEDIVTSTPSKRQNDVPLKPLTMGNGKGLNSSSGLARKAMATNMAANKNSTTSDPNGAAVVRSNGVASSNNNKSNGFGRGRRGTTRGDVYQFHDDDANDDVEYVRAQLGATGQRRFSEMEMDDVHLNYSGTLVLTAKNTLFTMMVLAYEIFVGKNRRRRGSRL
jgi:hypothetical protein